MHKRIQAKSKGFFVSIIILYAIFTAIYDNRIYAADTQFKSEEELIGEARAAIDKYMKEEAEPAKKEIASVVLSEAEGLPRNDEVEEPAVVEEEPVVVTKDPEKQGQSPQGTVPVFSEEQPLPPVTSDGQQVTQIKDSEGNLQPMGESIDISSKGVSLKPAIEEPILKKMDVEKIGASPYYETYEGLRLLKYFNVAQRVEIYQEPRPIETYMLDAWAMRYLYANTPWDINSDYRTQIRPIFTRAYGTEITMNDPKNKEGQIRYTHDYREIYDNYSPKYTYNNSGFLKKEMWDQNEVLLMHSKEIDPIGWLYTFNFGYRYSTMSAKSDINYYEIRHTYLSSLSLAPTDRVEYFFQGEYFKSMHVKASYDYRPDHFLGRTEIRIKSKDYKTVFVPQFSFSKDLYHPTANTFEKYEIALRVGRDFTKRFSGTTTLKYVHAFRDEPDNQAPSYAAGFYNPQEDKADTLSWENRLSYNIYDRLYIQTGFDLNNGFNWSIFDNWGLLGGIEYYAPGMIRVNVGWRGNYYYNLADFLSCVYFKFYLFM